MRLLFDTWESVQAFLEAGGDVLKVIFVVTMLMWALILERMWYFRRTHPALTKQAVESWKARKDRTSWYALQIRRMQISQISQGANRSLAMIKTFVALCPLLGLLGTVTGMIEVFDVMALVGSGNPRAMASGVSMATIPTMAGMVAALSGLYFAARLNRIAQDTANQMEDHLVRE